MKVYKEANVDPRALVGEVVAVLGYGIQGRAQSITLRDSGVDVVMGKREDAYASARREGFDVPSLEVASQRGQLVVVLLCPTRSSRRCTGLRFGQGLPRETRSRSRCLADAESRLRASLLTRADDEATFRC